MRMRWSLVRKICVAGALVLALAAGALSLGGAVRAVDNLHGAPVAKGWGMDPNGNPLAQGSMVDPNGSRQAQGSMIDPDGAPRLVGAGVQIDPEG